jgi:thiamine biosynthesis lipoprotein
VRLSRRGTVWIVSAVLMAGLPTPAPRAHPAQTGTSLTVSDEIMGTTFSVTVRGTSPVLAIAAEAALEEAHRVDRLLSNYREDSEWSVLNRTAGHAAVRVSDELFALLARCDAHSRATDGAFDLTVGPLMRAWRFFRDEGAMPTASALAEARRHVGYDNVHLNARERSVRFARPGVELDPGGVGKGYAVDRMIAVLQSHAISDAFVSAGGSSIYAMGVASPALAGWPVTLRHVDASQPSETLYLRDQALSTSGSTAKFFVAGGQRFSHILDPRTGRPARGASSVSVVAATTLDSELWTKPYFVNGRAWTTRHIFAAHRVYFCGDDSRCAWIN